MTFRTLIFSFLLFLFSCEKQVNRTPAVVSPIGPKAGTENQFGGTKPGTTTPAGVTTNDKGRVTTPSGTTIGPGESAPKTNVVNGPNGVGTASSPKVAGSTPNEKCAAIGMIYQGTGNDCICAPGSLFDWLAADQPTRNCIPSTECSTRGGIIVENTKCEDPQRDCSAVEAISDGAGGCKCGGGMLKNKVEVFSMCISPLECPHNGGKVVKDSCEVDPNAIDTGWGTGAPNCAAQNAISDGGSGCKCAPGMLKNNVEVFSMCISSASCPLEGGVVMGNECNAPAVTANHEVVHSQPSTGNSTLPPATVCPASMYNDASGACVCAAGMLFDKTVSSPECINPTDCVYKGAISVGGSCIIDDSHYGLAQ